MTRAPTAIAIGGSAGALDVLMVLLERLPADFSRPVIVVLHTPRSAPSHLVEVLSRRCRLPVREPVDKEPIAPGTVYVASPGYHLLVEAGPSFAFSVDEPENFSQPSIDVLFQSAADTYGAGLVGVVLSGANQDGARGLAAVAAAGGMALVQSPAEAASAEMPQRALAACPSAEALSIAALAERIAAPPSTGGGQ